MSLAVATSASGAVVYNNGAAANSDDGYQIEGGVVVGDSFTLTAPTTIGEIVFASVGSVGDPIKYVDWSITDAFDSGYVEDSAYGASVQSTLLYTSADPAYAVYENIVSFDPYQLAAGTYWLNLQNAVSTYDASWQVSGGQSSASEAFVGDLGSAISVDSESFELVNVPEPSALVVLAGAIGVLAVTAGARRRSVGAPFKIRS